MKNTQKNATKVKAEVVKFNPALDCYNGFIDDELVNSIKNKTMKAAVLSYRSHVNAGQRSAWGIAKCCSRMKEDVRKEFESDEALAAFLGLASKSAFSKLSRLGEMAGKAQELNIGTAVASELLVLAGEKYGKLNPADHLEAVKDMTKDEAREYVRKFRVAIEDKQEDAQDIQDVQDAQDIQDVQDAQEEQEVEWYSPVKIDRRIIDSMEEGEVVRLKNALRDVCISFKIGMSDVWVL